MMTYSIILSTAMMAGLFLMLWSAVGFIQDRRFFASAPKAAQKVIRPKAERFKGQHTVGWLMMILALVLLAGAVILGAYDGIQKDFGFWQFFARFALMQLLLKAFDVLFFDWFLLCRSGFFSHYYPEVKGIYGPEIFGFNKKTHLRAYSKSPCAPPGRIFFRPAALKKLAIHKAVMQPPGQFPCRAAPDKEIVRSSAKPNFTCRTKKSPPMRHTRRY